MVLFNYTISYEYNNLGSFNYTTPYKYNNLGPPLLLPDIILL